MHPLNSKIASVQPMESASAEYLESVMLRSYFQGLPLFVLDEVRSDLEQELGQRIK